MVRPLHRRALAGLIATLMVLAVRTLPGWEIGRGPRYRTVFDRPSKFNGDVRVVEDSFARYLLFGRSVQTGQLLKNPDRSALRYVDGFHLGLAVSPHARRALFIGLGGGMGPRQFHDFYPGMRIDAVEIDPVVVEAARTSFALPVDDRLSVSVGDGRAFLAGSRNRYDLILLDAYDAHSAPPLLTTLEFMRLVRDHLNPGGALVANVIAAQEGPRSRFGRSEYRTVREAFGNVAAYPIQTALDPTRLGTAYENVMVVALRGARPPSDAETLRKVEALKRPEIHELALIARHGPIRAWPTADVDVLTDAHPPREDLFGS